MNKIRDEKCENCNRFSHCNNNELVCISKYRVKYQELEQVKQENKRLLEIINAKPLETVDIDSAFEIEKLKEQLQTKEQKIKSLKANIDEIVICDKKLKKMLDKKEQEFEELKETIDNFITDNNSLYLNDGKQPSNLDELQECMQSSMDEFYKYEQALDEIEEYCTYMNTFNKYNKTNKGLDVDNVLDIINKAKEQ